MFYRQGFDQTTTVHAIKTTHVDNQPRINRPAPPSRPMFASLQQGMKQHLCATALMGMAGTLLLSFPSLAGMREGVLAYQQNHYEQAASEFNALVPLQHGSAMYYLAVMAYKGQGRQVDVVEAAALFQLASEQYLPATQYEKARKYANALPQQFSAQQRSAYAERVKLLRQQSIEQQFANVHSTATMDKSRATTSRKVLHRVSPSYPPSAAKLGQSGSISVRLLVNPAGNVAVADVVNQDIPKDFAKATLDAVKQWRYETSNMPSVISVNFRFLLDRDHFDAEQVSAFINRHEVWQHAAAGSQQHQYTLAIALEQATDRTDFIATPSQPPLTDFNLPKAFANPAASWVELALSGPQQPLRTKVEVDEQGVVTRVESETYQAFFISKPLFNNNEHDVIKKKLNISSMAGLYRLKVSAQGQMEVQRLSSIAPEYTVSHWYEQAARGGDVHAQTLLSASEPKWLRYLAKQNNKQALAWHAADLWLDGQSTKAQQQLENAIAQGYTPANDILSALKAQVAVASSSTTTATTGL